MSTVLELASSDRNLTSLVRGLKAAHLEETLNGIGPFTILGPVNLAFGKISGPDSFDSMVKKGISTTTLSELMCFHVITGKKMLKDFRHGQKFATLHGQELVVTVKDGEVRINGAKILSRDRQGSNGVVHSIDAVNVPVQVPVS